jgi:hypothetical protein
MVRRFERDDAGYLTWLASHPDGYVLNTYMHVTSDYLVLHQARCRTVSRPPSPDRSWTFSYGKACADSRDELESWALSVGGKAAQPCGHCLGDPRRATAPAAARSGAGPRSPRTSPNTVAMTGEAVTIRIALMGAFTPGAPPFVIEGASIPRGLAIVRL